MSQASPAPAVTHAATPGALTPALTIGFALALGILIVPLSVPQPLVGLIGQSLALPHWAYGAVATTTLAGYAAGLFLMTPLADLFESRRLILTMLAADAAALATVALSPSVPAFLLSTFVVGMTTSAIQIIVPAVATLAPEARRGAVIGNVVSGMMIGLVLSRPFAGLVGDAFGWRGVYLLMAGAIALTALALNAALPQQRPAREQGYPALIASYVTLFRSEPMLRRHAIGQALCMGAFGVFWTAIALRLAAPPFSLGPIGIALFALAGAASAIVAPVAGRAGDRGLTRPGAIVADATIVGALVLAGVAGAGWFGFDPAASPLLALGLLAAAAALLDLGAIGDQTLGRRAVNMIRPEARGRLNGLFTGLFFVGLSVGSALAGVAWSYGGWTLVCAVGIGFGLAAFAVSLADGRRRHVFQTPEDTAAMQPACGE